jgi:hypothetical protein
VVGCDEHGNQPSSVKGGEFIHQLGAYRLLEKCHVFTCFHVGMLLGLFDHEDGGDVLHRKVG